MIPLGTSMDFESEYTRSKGCWDPSPILKPFMEKWTSATPTPDWIVDDEWCGMVGSIGFGANATEATTAFWVKTLKDVYKGDEGRKKARMAVICLLERDGLLLRLQDIKCPIVWLQVCYFYFTITPHLWILEIMLTSFFSLGRPGFAIRLDPTARAYQDV